MYAQHYQLQSDPFRLTPDPDFSFTHQSYGKAWAYMQYALRQGEGFLVVTGRPGSGKTTLVRSLLAELERQQIASAVLVSTRFDAADLVPMVAHAFGLPVEDMDKVAILKRLEEFLIRHARSGHPALLLIDEAQGLASETLQELYRLTNLYEGDTPLLQVFLVGQDQLRGVLHAAGWGELRQRLIAACHLDPLDLQQTHAYIRHRLLRSGWRGNPQFSDEAVRLIHRFSEGLPRRINTLCSRLMLFGSVHNKRTLDGDDVRLVLDELREERLHVDSAQDEDIAALSEAADQDVDLAIAADRRTDVETLSTLATPAGRTEPRFDPSQADETPAPRPAPTLDSNAEPRPAATKAPQPVDEVDLHIPGPRRRQGPDEPPARTQTFVESRPQAQRRGPRWVVLLVFALGMLVLFRNYLPIPDTDAPTGTPPETAEGEIAARATPEQAPNASEPESAAPAPDTPPDAAVLNQRLPPAPDAAADATDTAAAPPVASAALGATDAIPPQTEPAPAQPRPEAVAPQSAPEPSPEPASVPASVPVIEPIAKAAGTPGIGEPTTSGGEPPSIAGTEPQPAEVQRPQPPAPSPEVRVAPTPPTAPVPQSAPTVAAPAATPASAPLPRATEQASRARVQSLLDRAAAALEDYRLTIPEGDSAYAIYREVLRLDPDNEAARQGLADVVQRYIWLARRSLELGEFRRVEQYTERGLRLDRDNEELRALQRLLAIERERVGLRQ